MTPSLGEFDTYGIDPLDPNAGTWAGSNGDFGGETANPSAMGGAAAPAAPMQANRWLQILRNIGGQGQRQQQQQGQQKWNPVQTYSTLGNIAGGIGRMIAGYAGGGVIQGPTPGILGEAGPEMLQHQDGSEEYIGSPQVRMLGANGTDTITPLTSKRKPTPEGKNLINRLRVKHRFADGGTVDGEDDALTLADLEGQGSRSFRLPLNFKHSKVRSGRADHYCRDGATSAVDQSRSAADEPAADDRPSEPNAAGFRAGCETADHITSVQSVRYGGFGLGHTAVDQPGSASNANSSVYGRAFLSCGFTPASSR